MAKKGKNKEKKLRKEADALGTALGKVLERAQERGTAGNNLLGAVEKIVDQARAGKIRADPGRVPGDEEDG
eukprot:13322190-Alexandrium_andersonii.AAC.1